MAVDADDLYVAGHPAPPGRYRRVEPPDGRTVVLERVDVLPGSLDGHVALYERITAPPAFFVDRAAVELTARRHRVGTA